MKKLPGQLSPQPIKVKYSNNLFAIADTEEEAIIGCHLQICEQHPDFRKPMFILFIAFHRLLCRGLGALCATILLGGGGGPQMRAQSPSLLTVLFSLITLLGGALWPAVVITIELISPAACTS